MRNWVLPVVLCSFALIGAAPGTNGDVDRNLMQGEWQVTSVIDDGMLLPDKHVKTHLIKDGRIKVQGALLSFWNPDNDTLQEAAFMLSADTDPRTIDMIGRGRTRTRGIYLLAGDILMVCLAGPEAKSRPTDFSSPEGSNNLLMTLKRIRPTPGTTTVTARAAAPTTPTTPTTTTTQVSRTTPATPAGTATFTPAGPPKPPAPPVDPAIAMRQKLIGTWGHQDDNEVFLVTFNWDGSFSSTRTPKRGFRKIFRDPTRTSGSWTLENGVIVIRVTASTERDLQGQILSYRIRSLTDTQAVLIDSTGRMHVQWKTP